MESKKDQRVVKPTKIPVTQDETENQPKPLPPPPFTYTQVYHNFGCTPTSSVNPAGSYFYPSWFGNQMWNRPMPIQYSSMFGGMMFSNYPMAAGLLQVGRGSLLASAEKNMNSTNTFNKSLEPLKVTEEPRENGKRLSIPATNREGLTRSAASESMGKTVVVHDINNAGGSTKLSSKGSDKTKEERKRQEKRKSSKRSRIEIEIDRAELIDSVHSLDAENTALRKKLLDLSDECVKLTEENNSLLGELIEKYGQQTIVKLMNAQTSDSVAGGGQCLNNS